MKKTSVSMTSKLTINAVEYLFVEWLRRRGVYSAFRSNCRSDKDSNRAFRSGLRFRIEHALYSPQLGVGHLISMSFLFTHTPEGYAFWSDLSYDWHRFCIDFQNNFK